MSKGVARGSGCWAVASCLLVMAACLLVAAGCGRKPTVAKPDMDWVSVPASAFIMGSTKGEAAERPSHQVTLSAFQMARTETTGAQYRACVRAEVCTAPDIHSELCTGIHAPNNAWLATGRARMPINCVDWSQSQAFCRWVGGQLPTEAQWERAARAGSTGERYGELDAIAWHEGNADGKVHDVATRKPNALGFHDLMGNVWEWTADYYAADWYARSPATDPTGPTSGERRVSRGGGIHMKPEVVRSAYRHDERADERFYFLGFRCARRMPLK